MATAEEAAQRVYAKKLAADRESKKGKRAEVSQEQQVFWHGLFEQLPRLCHCRFFSHFTIKHFSVNACLKYH